MNSPAQEPTPSTLPLGQYLFNRQYLLAQRVPASLSHWPVTKISTDWLCVSKNISVVVARAERGSIAGIGELLDSRAPLRSNRDVVDSLLGDYLAGDRTAAFLRVEKAMDYLGGRWVVVADLDGEARVYPDCFGNRSTVYSTSDLPELHVATQPQLIADVCDLRRSDLARRAERTKAVHWAGTLTPYDEVRRLLPNTYLDLSTGRAVRFWPRAEGPDVLGLESTAELMAGSLRQLAVAASARWPLRIGLTAGRDSRLTLAATYNLPNVEAFTQLRRNKPPDDAQVAAHLAKLVGVPHRIVYPNELAPERVQAILHIMRHNGANMRSTNASATHYSINIRPEQMLLISHGENALRTKILSEDTEKKILRSVAKSSRRLFDGHSEAHLRDAEQHLAAMPSDSWLSKKELWNWERYLGDWIANKYVVIDTVAQLMALQNCRHFQTMGLVLPEGLRQSEDNRLYMSVLSQLNPQLVEVPFNAHLSTGSSDGPS